MQRFTTILISTIIVLCYGCSGPQAAQQQTTAPIGYVITESTPEAAGMYADSLAQIDELVQHYIDQKVIAGAVVCIARQGKIAYHKAIGMKNVAQNEPLATDAIFRIASQTKAITSVAIMMLAEQGKLSVSDPVSKYIPEFANPTVLASFNAQDTTYTTRPANGEITIKHLLTHTSGIQYGFADTTFAMIYAKAGVPDLAIIANTTIANKMQTLGGLPLKHDPGAQYSYGLSTDVLGRVVEVASGQSLAAYFKQHIFEPLGMADTWFYLPEALASRLVTLYSETPEGIQPMPDPNDGVMSPDFPITGAKAYYSGGSGLSSTAKDYAVFLQMLTNGGVYNGNRLLKEATVQDMLTNQIDSLSLNKGKFGYGFYLTVEDNEYGMGRKVGRFAWGGAFNTIYWADPARQLVVTLMMQSYPHPSSGPLERDFEIIVNQAVAQAN